MNVLVRKSLLYKSRVEYADYALNHVEGCAHGCTYPCYAMMMKKRCGAISEYDDWIRPKIVKNALELLRAELVRLKHKIKEVFLCFATDPFMYNVGNVQELTLEILKELNRHDVKAVLISKGVYPAELLREKQYSSENEYGVTVVSLSEDFRRCYEPFAAPVHSRISALRRLHNAGLKTWVSMEPYPTPNILRQDIMELLREVSFVDRIVFGKWNYNGKTGGFRGSQQFYDSMAMQVMKFCRENDIKVRFKTGTLSTGFLGAEG